MGGNVLSTFMSAASGFVVGCAAGGGVGAAICAVGYEGGAATGEAMTSGISDAMEIGAVGGASGGGFVGAISGGLAAVTAESALKCNTTGS